MTKKEFDAVKMMREAREKLNREHRENPSQFWKRLKAIAEKMGITKKDEKRVRT